MIISGATRLVFLAGDPIGHTKGYAEYAAALAVRAVDAVYLPLHVPEGRFGDVVAGLGATRNVAGIVATVPHKLAALAAGTPDAAARRAGSANVLRPRPDGSWECSQVDGAGFLAAIDQAGMSLGGKRVQVLGAGGAGRAVAMAIAARAPGALKIHDPDPAKQTGLVEAISGEYPGVVVAAGLERGEVLVNCSTVGMGDDDRLPLPPELIPDQGECYDVVNRVDTALLLLAAQRGCRCDYGRSMMLAEIPLILDYLFGS